MKTTKLTKLQLNRDTIRMLTSQRLGAVQGGRIDLSKQLGICDGPSIGNSACAACLTDVDCATGDRCFSFEPGCG
jgi:hypothetical protein